MTETIIENLKILSENFKHKFDTFSNSVIFVNDINKIRIYLENKTNLKVTYNLNFDEKMLLISEKSVYHFCLELFKRKDNDIDINIDLFYNTSKTIDIDEWFRIEKTEALDIISVIQKEIDYNYRLKKLSLESSRFQITYFIGLLILEDKMKEYFSNVFDFRNF